MAEINILLQPIKFLLIKRESIVENDIPMTALHRFVPFTEALHDWIITLYNHDIHFNEICCPFPWYMVCTCCQLHCIPRSCCYLTALNPQAVWHLLEVNWVHYLIAVSTGSFQSGLYSCMQTVNRQTPKEKDKLPTCVYIYFFISTSTPTSNRSLLSGIRTARACSFFFIYNLGFEWISRSWNMFHV